MDHNRRVHEDHQPPTETRGSASPPEGRATLCLKQHSPKPSRSNANQQLLMWDGPLRAVLIGDVNCLIPLFFQDFHEKRPQYYRARGCLSFPPPIVESRVIKQDSHLQRQSRASSHSKHERTSREIAEESTQAK